MGFGEIQPGQPGQPMEYGLGTRPAARSESRTVFAQTMFLVAIALVSWRRAPTSDATSVGLGPRGVGRRPGAGDRHEHVAQGRPRSAGDGPAVRVGVLFGVALGPTLAEYASAPGGAEIIGQAAGLTALFIGALGTVGYVTKRDLSWLGRISFFALLALIVFGIVMIFVSIPYGNIIYCVVGLVIFAGYTLFDFNRLRRAGQEDVPLIALSIFLDVVNVFLLILSLLGNSR